MTNVTKQQQLIDDFALFDDWLGKYEYIIDLGRELPDFPEAWQIDDYRIHGCQAQVWIHSQMQGEQLHFDASSDAMIVKGLIAIVLQIYSDKTPQQILDTKPDFITDIGLDQHLSPTRSNGLHHMLKAIYATAEEHR
tara:strand:- start:3984 stop:4394 length:411 start_codon:yes stop_codon:yes gene_type:complete